MSLDIWPEAYLTAYYIMSQQSRIGPHISLAMTSILYAKKVKGAR